MSSISDGWKKLIASLFQSKQSSSQEPDPVAPTTAPMRSKLLKGLSSPRRGR